MTKFQNPSFSKAQSGRVSVVDSDVSKYLPYSVAFHVLIVAAAIVGKPYIDTKPVSYERPVSVEIMTIDELTQTDQAPLLTPQPQEKPREAQTSPPPKPAFSKPDFKTQKIVRPQSLPETVREELARPAPPDLSEEVAELKEPVEMQPLPPIVPDTDKNDKNNEETDPAKTEEQFQNILVQLMEEENKQQAAENTDKPDEQEDAAAQEPAPDIQRISNRLTISEQDALRQQISECWNVMAGAKNAEDLAVNLRLRMNPDRTVQSYEILDRKRYLSDSFFRAAADSAVRAIRTPKCIPLRLPPEKYDEWRVITIRFDPSEMF